MATNKKQGNWQKRTLAVRAGQLRSPFQETCEPLFFTAGYAYENAEQSQLLHDAVGKVRQRYMH